MSDKFRKSFRSLLACGRFNPARQSAAAAMAATMATDAVGRSETRNPHYDQTNSNCRRQTMRTSTSISPRISPNQGRDRFDRGCVNVTALALVEMPKNSTNNENNHANNSDSSLLASKIDVSSSTSSAGSTSSHQPCPRHQRKDKYGKFHYKVASDLFSVTDFKSFLIYFGLDRPFIDDF